MTAEEERLRSRVRHLMWYRPSSAEDLFVALCEAVALSLEDLSEGDALKVKALCREALKKARGD